jgi:predicted nuclease of predicted toxin-antitoxin system
MRFLIDANQPRAVVAVVRSLGHHTEFARDIGLGSATDEQIAKHALQYRAALLTRHLDFADIRRYPPDRYSGIVVLRLPDTAMAAEIAAALKRFLSEPGFIASLAGRLAVVEGDRVRFRPPLAL